MTIGRQTGTGWLLWVGCPFVLVALVWSGWEVMSARQASIDLQPLSSPHEVTARRGFVDGPSGSVVIPEILSIGGAVYKGGIWYLLDSRSSRVHRVNAEGRLLGSFGEAGHGPGEFQWPEALAIHGDTLVVAERLGGVLRLFDLDGSHIGDRVVRGADCAGPGTAGLASSPSGLVLQVVCLVDGARLEARLFPEDPELRRRMAQWTFGASRAPEEDPYLLPVITSHSQGILVGLAGDECLHVVGHDGEHKRSECHDWIRRWPLPEGERANLQDLRARASAVGRRLAIPDELPPFDAVFRSGEVLVYRAMVAGSAELRRLVVQTDSGNEEVLSVPEAPFLFVSDGRALSAWEDMEGTRILLSTLPWG